MEELIILSFRAVLATILFALEGLAYWPFDYEFESPDSRYPKWLVFLFYFCGGCALGLASLLLFPHTWLSESPLRILNLIVTPLAGGAVGFFTAKHLYNKSNSVQRRAHFWSGFLFALGISSMRFVACDR